MKSILLKASVSLMAASFLMFTACKENTKIASDKSKEAAEEKNENKFDTKATEQDAQFVVDNVSANQAEIKLARLAQKKSTDAKIKELAQLLEQDHVALLNELKGLASKKGISVPAELTDNAIDKYEDLDKKNAKDFDKAWIETLMDKHEKSIKKFEGYANDATDADLKTLINNALPKLRKHHDKLMEHNKKH